MVALSLPALRKNICLLLAIAASAFAAFPVAALMLFNAPANAIRIASEPYLSAYVDTFFYQNWSFFAPNPIDRDFYLIARTKNASGHWTAWRNISIPLILEGQRNRLSSKEMILTGVQNAILDSFKDGSAEAAVRNPKDLSYYKHPGIRVLYRTAASMFRRSDPGESYTNIQVGIDIDEYPRFTRRARPAINDKRMVLILPQRPFPQVIEFPW